MSLGLKFARLRGKSSRINFCNQSIMFSPSALKQLLQTAKARVAPLPGLKHSAVLMILFEAGTPAQTHAVFIMKTADGSRHGGQIAFPGGRVEPEDSSTLATALRETREEIGIAPEQLEVMGSLGHFSTLMTGYDVAVFVARPRTAWHYLPQDREVAAILEIPLPLLIEQFDASLTFRSREDFLNLHYHIAASPFIKYQNENWPAQRHTICIWGFTARVLHHFLSLALQNAPNVMNV